MWLVKRLLSYVSSKAYERDICAANVQPVPIEMEAASPQSMEKMKRVFELPTSDPAWWNMYATIIYPGLITMAAATLTQVERIFREDPPDLILYDRLAFAGRILATRLNIPAIQIYPHFAFYKKFMHRENGVCMNPEPMLEFSKVLDVFLAANGIEGTHHLWHTEKLNIYFLPKELQYHAEYFDERSCFVGACLRKAAPAAQWSNRSKGRPIILVSDVSVGTDAGYFNKFIDALSGCDYHVILSIGRHMDEASIKVLPANFEK